MHLIVEWHLHQVPKEHRLDALALKLALRSTLNHGCKIPVDLMNEEFRSLNYHAPVPGLLEETMRHLPPGSYEGNVGRLGVNYTATTVWSKHRPRHSFNVVDGVV